LTLYSRELHLRLGPRTLPLRVLPDGTYVISGGLLVHRKVKPQRDTNDTPIIELVGLETVRRTVDCPQADFTLPQRTTGNGLVTEIDSVVPGSAPATATAACTPRR
jgi:hypothetical protein